VQKKQRKSLRTRVLNWIRDPQHKWMKLGDFVIQEVVCQAKDDREKKYFNDSTIERFEASIERLYTRFIRLSILNYILLSVLLASVYHVTLRITVPGYNLSLDSIGREILLVASVNVGAASTFTRLHYDIFQKIALSLRSLKTPDAFELSHLDRKSTVDFFTQVPGSLIKGVVMNSRTTLIGLFGILFFYVLFLAYLVAIIAATGYIHVEIMLDIWRNPSLPASVSHLVVIYSAAIDILTIVAAFLLDVIPFRYRDKEIHSKYTRLWDQGRSNGLLYLTELYDKARKTKRIR